MDFSVGAKVEVREPRDAAGVHEEKTRSVLSQHQPSKAQVGQGCKTRERKSQTIHARFERCTTLLLLELAESFYLFLVSPVAPGRLLALLARLPANAELEMRELLEPARRSVGQDPRGFFNDVFAARVQVDFEDGVTVVMTESLSKIRGKVPHPQVSLRLKDGAG
eukprot:1369884-Rhodomonas_salina.4